MSERPGATGIWRSSAEESPTTPMHNATVEMFDPGESGFDHERLVELIADRISFVPRYRQRRAARARPAGQPGVGRRPELRPRLPRTSLRAAAAGHATTSCASWSRASSRARWTAVRPLWEVYFVEGLGGRPGGGALQVPPGAGRRGRHRRHRPGAARHLAGADAARRRRVAPARSRRRPPGWSSDAVTDNLTRARARWSTTARGNAGHAATRRHGGRARRAGSLAAPSRAAARPRVADHRPALPAAPLRRRPHRPGRPTAPCATSTAAPSTTSSWRPSPGRCADWLMARRSRWAGCARSGRSSRSR